MGGFSKYTVYTIAGEKVGGDGIERRFSEFFSLREKLRERWPGIYIPNTPPKKAVGNMDQKFIEKRTRLLNDFCFRLGRIPYLLDSQEINIFTSEGKDFTKKLEKLPKIELEEMLDRYTQAFPEYYETYDILVGKDKIVEFQRLIKKNLIDLKLLKTYCHAAYDKKNSEIGTYIKFIQSLESHEKLALMEFVDGDQNKLMFFNVSNSDLSEKTVKLGWNIKNPFKGLIWFVEEQEMDLEAYDESLNSFFELDALIEKLCNKIENLDKEIKKVQYGTKESKSKEKKLEALEQDKNITEKKYEQLKSIEKFAAYSYEINIPIFKQEKVYDYYETIRRFAEIMYHNESYNMEMWNIVRDGVDKYKAAGAA